MSKERQSRMTATIAPLTTDKRVRKDNSGEKQPAKRLKTENEQRDRLKSPQENKKSLPIHPDRVRLLNKHHSRSRSPSDTKEKG